MSSESCPPPLHFSIRYAKSPAGIAIQLTAICVALNKTVLLWLALRKAAEIYCEGIAPLTITDHIDLCVLKSSGLQGMAPPVNVPPEWAVPSRGTATPDMRDRLYSQPLGV